MDGLVEEWTGGSLRWRSPPVAKPFCFRAGERSRPSGSATFLKVMVHSMSSPANTVASFHCTNTRIFDGDMIEGRGGASGEIVGSSSDALIKRHGDYQASTAEIGIGRDGGMLSAVDVVAGAGRTWVNMNVLRHPSRVLH